MAAYVVDVPLGVVAIVIAVVARRGNRRLRSIALGTAVAALATPFLISAIAAARRW